MMREPVPLASLRFLSIGFQHMGAFAASPRGPSKPSRHGARGLLYEEFTIHQTYRIHARQPERGVYGLGGLFFSHLSLHRIESSSSTNRAAAFFRRTAFGTLAVRAEGVDMSTKWPPGKVLYEDPAARTHPKYRDPVIIPAVFRSERRPFIGLAALVGPAGGMAASRAREGLRGLLSISLCTWGLDGKEVDKLLAPVEAHEGRGIPSLDCSSQDQLIDLVISGSAVSCVRLDDPGKRVDDEKDFVVPCSVSQLASRGKWLLECRGSDGSAGGGEPLSSE